MILTLTTNPAIDRTVTVPVFAVGAVNRAEEVSEVAAGKGVNVTKALLAHGHDSEALIVAGGPTGALYRELLDVPAEFVEVEGNTRINTTIISEDTTTKINEPGPRISEDELQKLYTTLHQMIDESQAEILVVSGSLNLGLSSFFYEKIRRIALSERIKLAVDSSGMGLKAAIERGGLVVAKPNLEELEELTGEKLTTLGEVIEAAWKLLDYQNERVLVSLGEHGAVLVDEDRAWYAQTPKVPVKSTVAAGDSMLAGYLSALDKSPEEALTRAVAWGASAVQQEGSQVASPTTTNEKIISVTPSPPMNLLLK